MKNTVSRGKPQAWHPLRERMALLVSAACAACVFSLSAKTVYVNCRLGDYSSHDGSTPEKALETIQEGIDRTVAGDTVLVAPGVYDKGSGGGIEAWGPSRIGWVNRGIYILATSPNPADTVILGARSPETPEGYGAGGVRCISAYNGGGSVIRGFTLRDGHSESTAAYDALNAETPGARSWQSLCGGAACVDNQDFTLADCIIEDCSGESSGAAYCGTYVRCRIMRCANAQGSSLVTGTSSGETSRARLYCCVLDHNRNGAGGYVLDGIMILNAVAYNCTFVNNFYASCCYSAGESFFNCLFWGTGALNSSCAYANCMTDAQEPRPIVSTIHADVRLLPGSRARAAGDAAHLAGFSLSEEAARLVGFCDFGGNELPSSGAIAAGADQTVATPAAGGVASSVDGVIDGHRVRGSPCSYAFPTAYPTQYVFTASSPDPTRRVAFFLFGASYMSAYDYRFPDRDDRLLVMPPADPSVTITNIVTTFLPVCYLKPDADASVADGSADRPYRTFRDALAAHSGDRVYVAKKGVYAEGEFEDADLGRARVRLADVVRITSESGARDTFIAGARDAGPDADSCGRGPNALRAVMCTASMSQVQGFTLTGGHTDKPGGGRRSQGGAANGNGYLHIDDCIVSNNCAVVGGALVNVWAARTYVADNRSADFAVSDVRCCGCVIERNALERPANGIVGGASWILHTDVLGARAVDAHAWSASSACVRYASVFRHGDTAWDAGASVGNVYDDFMAVRDTAGGLVADPLFADPANGDWRPFVRSPVFGCGVRPAADNYGRDYCRFATTDFEGNPIAFPDGKPVAGAFMEPTSRRVVAIRARHGGVSVTEPRVFLEEGGSLTVAAAGGTRPCVGVTVNGVTNGLPVSIAAADAAGGLDVAAIYTDTWYVDATNGDDANDGFTAATAKRTLAAALDPALVWAGDTVCAAEGLYDEGTMRASASEEVASRVVVTNGVTLVATGARERTIIEGEAAAAPDAATYAATDDMRGMGRGAVRCVLLRRGATVRGFTVRNGFARGVSAEDHPDVATWDCNGGGIAAFAEEGHGSGYDASFAEDCLVTNCAAFRGGGAFAVTCTRCAFVDNLAVYGGGATSDARLRGCLSRDNKAHFPWSAAYRGHLWNYLADGCTVMDGLITAYAAAGPKLLNTVVSGDAQLGDVPAGHALSCVIAGTAGTGVYTPEWMAAATGTVVIPAARIALDENGAPIPGRSPAIDGADPSLSTYEVTDRDVCGGQRVYNGAMDIGAVEGDWRPVYSRCIRRNGLAVTDASPSVTDTDGVVTLTGASSLSVTWANPGLQAGGRLVAMDVTGNGTLYVRLNGEAVKEVTAATADKTFAFDSACAESRLDFTYVPGEGDTGAAMVLNAKSLCGALLRLR